MMNAPTRYREPSDRITALLEQHAPRAIPIRTIARELGIDRKTVAKYLELLAASGDVSLERFGQKKLYRRAHRLPLPEVLHRLPNALVILDGDLQVSMVNASFVATLGIHPPRNLVGARLLDLDLPVFSEPAVRRNIERIHGAETYLDEMQLIDDGTDRVYLLEFAPIVTPPARPGVMVSLRDITATRKAEAALKNAEQKMATLFETAPCGIVIFTASGTVLNANPTALRALGLRTFEQLRPASIFALVGPPETLEELIAKGRAAEIELAIDFYCMRREQVPCAKPGGASFDAVFTPIRRDGGGGPGEFAILFRDITEDRYTRRDLASQEIRS
ncbi:MAG TPA: PAS domain-containing protein [Methanoregulaceae archaeon]|nr:PAS domain-containing protein [Methanoregulaceae archaeon]